MSWRAAGKAAPLGMIRDRSPAIFGSLPGRNDKALEAAAGFGNSRARS